MLSLKPSVGNFRTFRGRGELNYPLAVYTSEYCPLESNGLHMFGIQVWMCPRSNDTLPDLITTLQDFIMNFGVSSRLLKIFRRPAKDPRKLI